MNVWYAKHIRRGLYILSVPFQGLILGLRPSNERRRYFVTTSLIAGREPRISPDIVSDWEADIASIAIN